LFLFLFEILMIILLILKRYFDSQPAADCCDINEYLFTFKHTDQVITSIYLPNRDYLIVCDSNKKLLVINCKTNEILVSKLLVKRPVKLISKSDESLIVIGDKTGDVYTFQIGQSPIEMEKEEIKIIMGHLSVLTDISFYKKEKFLITSDRDEKCRISHFPNCYNIDSYLLCHKEFDYFFF
jgi:WD40 repeat protein